MRFQALTEYYDRLQNDPEQDVADFGFARERISFCIVLNSDGSLAEPRLQDIRSQPEPDAAGKTRGKAQPQRLIVPDRGGRSGTLLKPNFMWDNTGYALGADSKGKPERSRAAFEAFRQFHRDFLAECDDAGLRALCAFLDQWDPQEAPSLPHWDEACDANIVFKLSGATAYLHDSPTLKAAWAKRAAANVESAPGVSLLSGEPEPIARLHPLISGVAGAQTTGAAIVSFNLDAFESYGKTQSFNAPVGVRDAFRYTTALNRLTADARRRIRLADMTLLFWSEAPTSFEEGLPAFFDEYATTAADDESQIGLVRAFFQTLRQGRAASAAEAAMPFYVLGLSPNASRLAVRVWLQSTVGEFAARLKQHVADIEIDYGRPDGPPLTLKRLLDQTARERKDIAPLLEGAVLRAILTGGPYPLSLVSAVLRRIRADGRVDPFRAAILKAYLVRRARLERAREEQLVSLNLEHPNPAYHLGRLFAVLEKTQEEAFDDSLNATIKDRYFSSASANPVAAFPRLMRMHTHHLNKIEHAGRRVIFEKLAGEIYSHICGFPPNLSLPDQGLFFVGYYHQYQSFFEKRNRAEADSAVETNSTNREGN